MDASQFFSLIFLNLCLLFGGCGNISKIVHMKSPIMIEKKSSFSLATMNCNHSVCQESQSDLHKVVAKSITESISSKGHSLSNQKTDYQLVIVSAFEGDIEHHTPRNLYLIIRNNKGQEMAQIAVAESFSSPLDKEHVNLDEVEKRIVSGFDNLMVSDPAVASITN